jgi:hypothetical protein
MIISISGKANSGKDLVGKIIQYLFLNEARGNEDSMIGDILKKGYDTYLDYSSASVWKIKKFEDKLKDIVCILLGCTREDLENEEFKNKELGEEWTQYVSSGVNGMQYLITKENYLKNINSSLVWEEVLTPRKLLQLIGTECGKEIINPDLWINSLMRDYKAKAHEWNDWTKESPGESYPNWIITDLKFPNEYKAVQKRNGLHIHLERFKAGDLVIFNNSSVGRVYKINHLSEKGCELTSIDGNYQTNAYYSEISIVKNDTNESKNTKLLKDCFDENVVYLYNVGTINELIEKIKELYTNKLKN